MKRGVHTLSARRLIKEMESREREDGVGETE
jgi:hypothetical protein